MRRLGWVALTAFCVKGALTTTLILWTLLRSAS